MDNVIETIKEKVEEVLHPDENVSEKLSPVEKPIEEPKPVNDESVDDEVAPQEEVVDRSAFNCPACGGEGLKDGNNQFELCSQCGGTGKV